MRAAPAAVPVFVADLQNNLRDLDLFAVFEADIPENADSARSNHDDLNGTAISLLHGEVRIVCECDDEDSLAHTSFVLGNMGIKHRSFINVVPL